MFENGNRRPCCMLALVFTAVAALHGCASQIVNISPEDRAAIKSAPAVYVVRYTSPPLSLMTPKDAAPGGLLSAVIVSKTESGELPSGAELERAYKLPSSSEEITNRFVQKLKTEGGLANLRVEPKPLPLPFEEDVARYRKYAGGLVLEINANSAAGYQAMNWKTYNFNTYGRVRLIRPADGKVLWLDTCAAAGFNDPGFTLDVSEFEANNGARLKQLIQLSGERCSRILTDKLLGKTS